MTRGGERETWASDVRASMPVPPSSEQPLIFDMAGFGFTTGGISHDLTDDDVETLSVPTFAPPLISPSRENEVE